MTFAIETQNLTRTFDDFTAVDDVTLRVREGEIFGYLGLNGAGKSTTIKMLTTLLRPSCGVARVAGHDVVSDALAVRRVVGLVSDEAGESRPSWTPREYLGYFARVHGLPRPQARVEATLDVVGLEPAWRGRAIASHSTGMKRRVEIARALLAEPRVLFLDEPTRGLDLPAKRATWELLRGLARERRVTIFLSSHEVAEIRELCGRLAVISRGRINFVGEALALGRDPAAFESALLELLAPEPASKPSNPAAG